MLKDGSFVGKLGTVVGCSWKGKPYVRRLPVRTTPPTMGELANRHVFDLVNTWLKPIHEFVRLGFRNYSPMVWGVNAASSLLHKTAIHKAGFASSIDPALVQVSSGDLELPEDLQMLQEGDALNFTWDPGSGTNKGARDRIIILAYNIELKWAKQELSGSHRYMGSHSLSLTGSPAGGFHVYVAFIAGDGSRQSDSRYMGFIIMN